MWNYKCNDNECNIRDGVRAVVIGGCSKGVFLRLENGQEAFASFGGLVSGTEVFCTVLKKAKNKLQYFLEDREENARELEKYRRIYWSGTSLAEEV